MSYKTLETALNSNSSHTSLAFHYDGMHIHNHCRTQGLILATSEHEARLLLRSQEVVALRLSLVSAANPLISAQTATTQLTSPWQWLTPWIVGKHTAWQTQTLSLLAKALEQAPLLQALAIVERQLTALKSPTVWPAALLVWRDGLAKGWSCWETLQPFAKVWGEDWLAWVKVCELQGIPLAPLTPWIQAQQHRCSLQASLRPVRWRCYGWSIVLLMLTLAEIIKDPQQTLTFIANFLGLALPIIVLGSWMIYGLKKKLPTILKASTADTVRCGWAAWWMALHLQASDADNLSPLEALQMAVRIPSARQGDFLHHILAAAEAGQSLETVISSSSNLPIMDRLRFEAVQDSAGLRQSIETCWHDAEEKIQEQALRWLIGLEITLLLMVFIILHVVVN